MLARFSSTFKKFSNVSQCVTKYPDGSKSSENWFRDGVVHRVGKPASTCWYPNGQKSLEVWAQNGLEHRVNGPSTTVWDKDGKIKFVMWYTRGIWHKKNGGPIKDRNNSLMHLKNLSTMLKD